MYRQRQQEDVYIKAGEILRGDEATLQLWDA